MLPLYILVGGASSRFGVDKASFPVDGRPWAEHVASRLSSPGAPSRLGTPGAPSGQYTLVGRLMHPDALPGAHCIADAAEGEGPLTGVLAALDHQRRSHGEGLVAVASCDLVRPEPQWLAPLAAAHWAEPELEAAAYQAAGRWQPFPCVAHTRWTQTLRRLLAEGVRSWQQALAASRAHAEPWTGPADGPPQANTPAELRLRLSP
ncbi:molybdopterin-guanine dinucleotide biosynthesis protein MobA [Pirellulimonas nuda]|uniref:Molybdopterin-guanine dinucleotide biosynthesis protein MobA n=1 Tax=Pirellulimonas nuda TaxID=2528009 RepID=A0A518DGI7_9BACT|nr:NTP transferase domain-containing protein [Pirellulimonas nuda]QDU90591.1 molybdopterin-guanine dinucleotide biosynthesis protein MobA [Pirellulimonas nuda]